MPISPDAFQEFLDTEYRARLSCGGWAVIHIGEPLPRELHDCVENERTSWGFITAWNPFAKKTSRECNRAAQRELLAALRGLGVTPRAGIGVGAGQGRWREPSLFVTGLNFDAMDALGRRFEQAAIVRGFGVGIAELRVLL